MAIPLSQPGLHGDKVVFPSVAQKPPIVGSVMLNDRRAPD